MRKFKDTYLAIRFGMLKKNSIQLLSDCKWLKSCELCCVYLRAPRDPYVDGEEWGSDVLSKTSDLIYIILIYSRSIEKNKR